MGVVAALDAEARTLGAVAGGRRTDGIATLRNGSLVTVSGMGHAAAAIGARALADAGAGALVSWGMAGGLDPALPAGALCLPSCVIAHDGTMFAPDHQWCDLVGAAAGSRCGVVGGKLLTHDSPIATVSAKAAAFAAWGACAVDMESSAVAAVAASRGLPFIAVRAIVDTARDELPVTVLAASSGGQVNLPRLLRGLSRSPLDIVPLLRLAKRYRAAIRALRVVAQSGLPSPVAATSAAARSP